MRSGVEPVPFGPIDPGAEQVLVPMRDGVRLATDVYLPARPKGRLPCVLVRLPYDKSGRFSFMPQTAAVFTERGYAFVAQDVRGKVRSEGETFAFIHEVADGYDTLEWIVTQPWSSSVVGMFGDSYYGFTQWAAAASDHPALKAIVPRVTDTEIGTDWIHHRGVFNLFTAVEWATLTWVDEVVYEGLPDFSVRPLSEVTPSAQGGRRSPSLDRWMSTPPDDPFWNEGIYGVADVRSRVRIPALHSGGWWDVFQRGQIRDFQALARAGAPGQHLIMGSTDHFDDPLLQDGEAYEDFLHDPGALERFLPGYTGPALAFFDRYLLGDDGGPTIPAVRWHMANAGWREATDWPPPGTREQTLFLAGGSRALADAEGGGLAAVAERTTTATRWTHDPSDLAPDLIEDAWQSLAGLPDEREVETRGDVLTFSGEAAGEPLDLAGPVTLEARVRAGAPMHLAAKLVDVYPSGRARRILQGIALVPDPTGDGALARVDLGNTGYRLRPGHRLRLEVACSDFPRYLPDMGDGRNAWTAVEGVPREQELVVGGSQGATLTLTVQPPT